MRPRQDDITGGFKVELRRVIRRALRLARKRSIHVRANNINIVLDRTFTLAEVEAFAAKTPPCYVHITNLGRPSDAGRVRWVQLRYAAPRRLLNMWLGLFCTFLPAGTVKNSLYRAMGMSIGRDVEIAQGAFLDPFCPGLITIGDGTVIGSLATVFTHIYRGRGRLLFGPVVIGRDCVISGTATVAPGIIADEVTVLPNSATMPLGRGLKRGV